MGTIDYTTRGGYVLTVEFNTTGSFEAPSYSPIYGADSGDCPEVNIDKVYFRDGEVGEPYLHCDGALAERIEKFIFETYDFNEDHYYDYDEAEFI